MTNPTPSKLDLDHLATAQERIEQAQLNVADYEEELDHARRNLDNRVRELRAKGITYAVIREATGWSHDKITRVASEPRDLTVAINPLRR